MSIINFDRNGNRKESFIGCVIGEREHFWLDGMLEVNALVWNAETKKIESIQTGYFAITGQNQCDATHTIDCTPETAREVIRSLKSSALFKYAVSVAEERAKIKKGCKAIVTRGRKIKPGTVINVFWTGEKETYQSRKYSWLHETESITGGFTEDGQKIFVKTEYLKRLDPTPAPTAKERKAIIKRLISNAARTETGNCINLLSLAANR